MIRDTLPNGVEPGRIEQDVQVFVSSLLEHGVVELR
jgi:hypothetical protein